MDSIIKWLIDDLYKNSANDTEIILEDKEQVIDLASQILCLPDRLICILLFLYVYDFDEETTASSLEQKYVKETRIITKRLLARGMGFPEKNTISDETMKKACKISAEYYIADILNIEEVEEQEKESILEGFPDEAKHKLKKLRLHRADKRLYDFFFYLYGCNFRNFSERINDESD